MRAKLHHIGIVVGDIEASAAFFERVFGYKRVSDVHDLGDPVVERLCFLEVEEGLYIEPHEELRGHWKEVFDQQGRGFIREIGFAVDDIEEFYREMSEIGIELVSWDGTSFGETKYLEVPELGGTKCAWLPRELTGGILVEIMQRAGDVF